MQFVCSTLNAVIKLSGADKTRVMDAGGVEAVVAALGIDKGEYSADTLFNMVNGSPLAATKANVAGAAPILAELHAHWRSQQTGCFREDVISNTLALLGASPIASGGASDENKAGAGDV